MLEPQFQAAPEKFVVITSAEPSSIVKQPHQPQKHRNYREQEAVEILGNQFPVGSRAVTIQRGARGFGFAITEGKVRNNNGYNCTHLNHYWTSLK